MADIQFTIGTSPYTNSLNATTWRNIVAWRTSKDEVGAQHFNEILHKHEDQETLAALGEIEPGAKIGKEPAITLIQARVSAHFKQYYKRKKRRCGDYIKTLKKAATFADAEIKAVHAPYRFFFFEKDGNTFLDLIKYDTSGKVLEKVTRDITEDDFDECINNVREGKGMYLDRKR